MTEVLLFATTTGYQIRSFGEAAARRGARLVFASDRCDQLDDPWWDAAIPVRFHDDGRVVEAVRTAFAGRAPDGVLAVGDRPVVAAARTAAAFGLPWHPPPAAAASRNKLASRQAFRLAGLPTPAFHPFDVDRPPRSLPVSLRFPVVVKPLALSGSRGVMRADDAAELREAIGRLRRILQSSDVRLERDAAHQGALVESFVPGAEFAIEGLLTRGALTVLALFDKPDPLDGPYFEETIYVTPTRASAAVQRAIVAQVARAARALGLWHGPLHAECRVNGSGVFVLEVAARPIGGLCSRAVLLETPDGTAASLEDVLMAHALGEDAGCRQPAGASGVMMIPIPRGGILKGVDGVEAARAAPGVWDVRITAKPDAALVPLPEGRSYLGFIFARGTCAEEVEAALREAHARLEFRIDKALPVV